MPGQPPLDNQRILDASRQAARRPLDFDPKERATEVEKDVKEIRKLVAQYKTDTEIREQFPDFAKNYPTLFEYSLKPNFDQNNFKLMLGLLAKMGDRTMSQHQASVVVGQQMANRYIRPDNA